MKTHLVFAAMAAVLFAFAVSRTKRERFTFDAVVAEARALAAEPYVERLETVPNFLKELNYDRYREINFLREHALWKKQGLPFQAMFYFPGYLFSRPLTIYQTDGQQVNPVEFSASAFEYGKNVFPTSLPKTLGYAGFRFVYPLNKSDKLDEVISFIGASYFRALAEKQTYGISARGLALNTSVPGLPEEFPAFTKFWLHRPASNSTEVQVDALLDSPSVAGAYRFLIQPGVETRVIVKATLFFRKTVARVGLMPLTSMYWFGENTSNNFGDFRPEVHDSDGLLVHTAADEWIWRPLAWSKNPQLNAFMENSPRGFGLLQRDRDFSHYQDLEAKYHQRPSVWIEPDTALGPGEVQLIQLPTNTEFHDNVVAAWVPTTHPTLRKPFQLDYVLHWFTENSAWPPLARCISTRIDYQEAPYYRQLFLDFAGDRLKGLKPGTPIQPIVSVGDNGFLSDIALQKNEFDESWRVKFTVSTAQLGKPLELRCLLSLQGKPISETWTYTWHP